MDEVFRWDPKKNASNQRKHGISFFEAVEALLDPHAVTEFDDEHSEAEDRFRTLGMSPKLRILLVVHTDEHDATKIISARKATGPERQRYEQSPS